MIRRLAWAAALLLGCAPVAQARTYLASITVPLAANEYLSDFSIDTWGLEIVAVCRFPPGWRLTVGSDATPGGIIAGHGSLGATWLNRARMRELDRLLLMRLVEPVQRAKIVQTNGYIPATFSGTAAIGTYGEDKDRKARLGWRNVRLISATHCPARGTVRR